MNGHLEWTEFSHIEVIHKGWSSDKKYVVETAAGEKLLVRLSDISEFDVKKYEFELLKRFSSADIPMSRPVDFGICNDEKNVYQMMTWCDGKEAKEVLPSLSKEEQYSLGVKAGQILRRMQEVEYHAPSGEWAKEYQAKISRYIKNYQACGEKLFGEEIILPFLQSHAACIGHRPTALLHADFNRTTW